MNFYRYRMMIRQFAEPSIEISPVVVAVQRRCVRKSRNGAS